MSGGHGRGTIKTDLNKESQTGTPPKIQALESYNVGVYNLEIEAPIPTMQVRTVYLIPAEGVVLQVKALYMYANLVFGLGSGTHELEAIAGPGIEVLKSISAYNQIIEYNYRHWGAASITDEPIQEVSQGLALQSLIGDDSNMIYFVYRNLVNNTQNNSIIIDVGTREGVH